MNSGYLPFRVKTLHDEFGPFVRVSSNELSINDTRAWKDICSRRDMLRPPQWGARPPGVEAHNVISAPAADHARFRKALMPAYSEKSTQGYEPVVRSYFDKLIDRLDALILEGGASATVDIVEWTNFATFDIIGELAWSKSYGCLDTGTGHAFMAVLQHFQAALIGASIAYYPWLNSFVARITPKSALQQLNNVFQDGHERLQARLRSGQVEHSDLISHIAEYNSRSDLSEKLSDGEIEQNVLAIIVGGSETLTTTISAALHHLLADLPRLSRLTDEIRSSFASETEISAKTASKLPYLNAVINEVLRLCPPIPDMLRRQVPQGTPVTIAGKVIPPGTTVSISCYAMFKSSDHFSDPEAFKPERFLVQSDVKSSDRGTSSRDDMSAFHPFGLGPRGCLGQPLAMLEMRLLLALLLFRYDIGLSRDKSPRKWTDQKIYWTWEKQPLEIVLSRARRG
jgi:cytochrome P450